MVFDVIVIGKGLIGSAAAKYAAQQGAKVAAIGADEPTDIHQATVFSSHYDQGRIVQQIGADDVWTQLNLRAIEQFPAIAARSSINFFTPGGCLWVTDYDDTHAEYVARGEAFGIDMQVIPDAAALGEAFPRLQFSAESCAIYESSNAGYLNPRALCQAQLAILESLGGKVVSAVVTDVQSGDEHLTICTDDGQQLQSEKVIVATGAFTNFFSLLPGPLPLCIEDETVLLVEVPAPDEIAADRAWAYQLPSVLYDVEKQSHDGVYAIRPLLYPDGRWYLKLGCNTSRDKEYQELPALQQWFRSPMRIPQESTLRGICAMLLPGFSQRKIKTKPCVLTRTPTGRPYICRAQDPRVVIAVGGNGYAAMCSDAIGSLAASLLQRNELPAPFSIADFALPAP